MLQFAHKHLTWLTQTRNSILFSDGSKFQIIGRDGGKYIKKPKDRRYEQKYQMPTVEHGGRNIMVRVPFSRFGTGLLVQIDGIMD